MEILLINLDRRPDRLSMMSRQLDAIDFPFHHIQAVDSQAISRKVDTTLLTLAEIACMQSHQLCWQRIVHAGKPMLIMEDDLLLSPDLGELINALDDWPAGVDIIKLETYLARTFIMKKRKRNDRGGAALCRLKGIHLGAAAYALTPQAAQHMLDTTEDVNMPVDHHLFDPECSQFDHLKIYQVDPAPCVQGNLLMEPDAGGVFQSDLENERRLRFQKKAKKKTKSKLRREVGRVYYQISNIAWFIPRAVLGLRWRHITFSGSAEVWEQVNALSKTIGQKASGRNF